MCCLFPRVPFSRTEREVGKKKNLGGAWRDSGLRLRVHAGPLEVNAHCAKGLRLGFVLMIMSQVHALIMLVVFVAHLGRERTMGSAAVGR